MVIEQIVITGGTQRSLEKWVSAKFWQVISAERPGSQEEELLQQSTTVTVEESVEFPATLSKALASETMVSSLEKSKSSSMMKWSPTGAVLESNEWCFSGANCE